jgi:hypothetical protein
MALTLVGLAQAYDLAERVSVGPAPGIDADQDPTGDAAIGDDAAFATVAPQVVELEG